MRESRIHSRMTLFSIVRLNPLGTHVSAMPAPANKVSKIIFYIGNSNPVSKWQLEHLLPCWPDLGQSPMIM